MVSSLMRMGVPGLDGGGGVQTLIEDAFTDTNGTALSSHAIAPTNVPGTSWTDSVAPGMQVQSNRAVPGAGAFAAPGGISTCNVGVSDFTITATLRLISAGGGKEAGIVARFNAGDDSHYVVTAQLYASPAQWTIRYWNGSAYSTLASDTPALAQNTDYAVSIVVSGATITATIAGGNEISTSSATNNPSSTLVGVMGRGSGAEAAVDDFVLVG